MGRLGAVFNTVKTLLAACKTSPVYPLKFSTAYPLSVFFHAPSGRFGAQSDESRFLHYFSKFYAFFGIKPIIFYTFSFFTIPLKSDQKSAELSKRYKTQPFCLYIFVDYFEAQETPHILIRHKINNLLTFFQHFRCLKPSKRFLKLVAKIRFFFAYIIIMKETVLRS